MEEELSDTSENVQGEPDSEDSTPQLAEEVDLIVPSQDPSQEGISQSPEEVGAIIDSLLDQAHEENVPESAELIESPDFSPSEKPSDDGNLPITEDSDALISFLGDQPVTESSPQLSADTGAFDSTADDLSIDENTYQPIAVIESLNSLQQVQTVPDSRKIALILSGGGARGAFQVGAEMYARQVMGYHWDIIAGVSVGALNGAMLAMHRYQRLLEIWNTITDAPVYTGGFNLPSVIGLLLGAKSFYGNAPLQKMMKQEFEAGKIIDDLHVGVVSLLTGEYLQFTKEFLELPEALLASASIPVIWPPVDISPEHQVMVDGGVRNISPVGDVLELEPDEIVIINCSAEHPTVLEKAPSNVLSIGMRALDIMQNEIFVNDVKSFLRINALVQEAEKQGIMLHHPRTGRLLKYYPCVIIEPDIELGEVLDFSQKSVQTALKTGVRRAREVFGRP